MRVEKYFTASDLQAIEAAVHEAEKRTSGEIVPCAVAHSDHYEAAAWKGAVLGAFAAVVAAGINTHVGQHEWDAVVAGIVAGMGDGKPGKALGAAIARCGELLERHGVAIRADDTDELPDKLRMQEE